jgi:hypothetical protein
MAYQILTHQSLQTATNASAQVTAGLAQAGLFGDTDEAVSFFEGLRDSTFENLSVEAEKNNEALRKDEDSKPAKRSTGSKGKSKGSKGGNKTFTAEEAGEVELAFGKFRGATIAEVASLTAEEADEDYGYTTGPGRTWLEWAEENATSDYIKDAISAYLKAA